VLLNHSDPVNGIPSMYQNVCEEVNLRFSSSHVITHNNSHDEVEALLGLKNNNNSNGNSGSDMPAPSSFFRFDSLCERVPLTSASSGIYRDSTDMLISSLDLLSGTSATWNLEEHDLHSNLASQNALLAMTSTSALTKKNSGAVIKNENTQINSADVAVMCAESFIALPKPIPRDRTISDIFKGDGSLTDDMF